MLTTRYLELCLLVSAKNDLDITDITIRTRRIICHLRDCRTDLINIHTFLFPRSLTTALTSLANAYIPQASQFHISTHLFTLIFIHAHVFIILNYLLKNIFYY